MSRARQIIASVLVLSYGLVAVGGYGLHALLPCGDPDCVAEATSSTCSCSLCRHNEPETTPNEATDIDGPVVGAPDSGGHDSQTCELCALLAKVKLGGPTGPLVLDLCHHSTAEKCLHSSSVPSTFLLIHAPRGPPESDCQV